MPDPSDDRDPLLRAILESPKGIVIFALDRAFRYLAFNENHRRTMRAIWSVDIEVGVDMLTYLTVPEDAARARTNFERALAGDHFTLTETYGVGGREFEDSYSPIVGRDGAVLGLTVYLTDVTDARRAQEELLKYRAHLEEVVRDRSAALEAAHARLLHAQKLESLGLMAAGVAHDFNNLLVGILGSAELALAELGEGAPARARLERIGSAAEQAASLTRQLLAYAGQVPPSSGPIDLSRLVRECEVLARATVPRTAALEFRLQDNLPEVSADRGQLHQVVLNLVMNAAEASIEGRAGVVRITTGQRDVDRATLAMAWVDDGLAPGTYVSLRVEDDGEGIAAEHLPRLFDPFFTTRVTGRGLGLASVLGIVRNHRGAVFVSSARGAGASFEVLLPIRTAAPQLPLRSTGPTRKGTVLVIDDEEPVREVAAEVLRRADYEVLEAADGEAGVAILTARRDAIVAVLLDMTMPRLDGEAAFRKVREIAPKIPIVVVSGWTREHRKLRFLSEEANVAFLSKPFRIRDLVSVLQSVLAAAE